MSCFSRFFFGATFGCLLFASSPVWADTIPVLNASFETLPTGGLNFSCGAGCAYSFGPITGWASTGNSGQFQPGIPTNFNTVSDGPTSAYSNGGMLSQVVSATVQAGVTYTLNVDLGWRNDAPFTGSAALLIGTTEYLAGGTAVEGQFTTFTATYTGTVADAGSPITIQLLSSGIEGNFDNVRLTDTAAISNAPEPTAFSLFGLGLVGAGWLFRRRIL